MKRVITLLAAAAFSLAIVGCHGSVDTDTNDGSSSRYKKTTTYDNGSKTTTEKKTTTVNP